MNKRTLRITIGIVFPVFLMVFFAPGNYRAVPLRGPLDFAKPPSCEILSRSGFHLFVLLLCALTCPVLNAGYPASVHRRAGECRAFGKEKR